MCRGRATAVPVARRRGCRGERDLRPRRRNLKVVHVDFGCTLTTTMPNLVTPKRRRPPPARSGCRANRATATLQGRRGKFCRTTWRAGGADDAKGQADTVPLDPTHSVFERDLARHLKKCPRRARRARRRRSGLCARRQRRRRRARRRRAAEAPRAAAVAGGAIHYTLEAPSRTSQLGVVAREELLALVGRVERAHASLDDAVRGDSCVACVGRRRRRPQDEEARGAERGDRRRDRPPRPR